MLREREEQSYSEVRAEAASSWRRAFENSLVWITPRHWLLWLVAIVLVVLLGFGTASLIGLFGDEDPPRQQTAGQVDAEPSSGPPDQAVAAPEPVAPEPVAPAQATPEPATPEQVAAQPLESTGDDQFAAVAGVYRLQEPSLRGAIEPSVERFLSADGVIVIDPDGAVSGEYSYRYSETGYDTLRETEFVSEVTADTTIDPATVPRVEATENGFSFEATMVVAFLADPSNADPYVTPGASFDVTGLVDPESGLLELTVPGTEFTLDFLR